MTDVAEAAEASPRVHALSGVTAKDRAVLLEMLEGDDLADLFRQIVCDDFGPDASLETFSEDPVQSVRDPQAESWGADIF